MSDDKNNTRIELAPDLSISRIVSGLWQIADMERDGQVLDLDSAASAMDAYVDAGLTTFDMADHYGSAEEIVGRYIEITTGGHLDAAEKAATGGRDQTRLDPVFLLVLRGNLLHRRPDARCVGDCQRRSVVRIARAF